MKALIETENNNRIAQVEPNDHIFPVSPALQWVDCPENCTTHWTYSGEGQFSPVIEQVQTLDEAKTDKLAEINAACDRILNAATATYPASEVLTFDQQTAEAQAYQADNTASVPLLSALSVSRNIPLPELVQRVLAKHDEFSALSGTVIGQRQALEDILDTLTTVESVQELVVNIQMPEATA